MKSFRRWLHDKHGIYGHSQNLCECPKCGTPHGIAWYGRNWLHLTDRKGFSACWLFFMKRIGAFTLSLQIGGGDSEDDVMFHVSVPRLFSVFLTAEGFIPCQCRKVDGRWRNFARTFELRYDLSFGAWGSLWWKLGAQDEDWYSSPAKWQAGSFDPADFFLGRPKYSERKIGDAEGYDLKLPEAVYSVVVQMEEAAWKRPRWPFPKVVLRAEVTSESGVPIPGKGENSWDCGDGASYSLCTPAATTDEAASKFLQNVLETRRRYASESWVPGVAA